ncbi:MAG: glycosyhydrolase, partial [Phocaeicola dorei]|nr:glycosyhydrolase [Phocaeicola dorei]
MKLKKCVGIFLFSTLCLNVGAIDHKGITFDQLAPDRFTLMENGVANEILVDEQEDAGVMIAVRNLQNDFKRVSGRAAGLCYTPGVKRMIMVGTLKSRYIRELVKAKKIDASLLEGKNEKYLMTVVSAPLNGVDEALVIAGSDKRGTIYGIYELSEQIGVSPWYDWADVPVMSRQNLSMTRGSYTAGEPAVKYRGIFLNDEAPCLTGWVKHTYGTNYGDHRFYARVFELILRLRGNFMWPAMWGWSFYADDPENSKTAHEMGIIMGTSHHEPMARNHQEWVRKRSEYGAWDYASNQQVIDRFFREGMERAAGTEDLITIGMRGDGDTPMGGKEGEDDKYVPRDEENMCLMEKIFRNQRRIIKEVTGKVPEKRPQVWAIYKEVQRYYDMGLRVPDDVIMLLSDDNWGDVRRLPDAKERKHSGGWGMYYHVDYVGAPRNSKWLNVTPIQNMWEQLQLTYSYGVDKLWILNVGDLKPNEFPTDFFLKMAWNPNAFDAGNLMDYTREFCRQQFGDEHADEAARILNLHCKYCARVTAEMLDHETYNLQSGEFKAVTDEFLALEAHAVRQFTLLPENMHDVYKELILFPVQAMANLYEMYYAVAMNRQLAMENDLRANAWADRAEYCFRRDAELCDDYNHNIAGGKWKHMMDQTHIGYTSWDEPKGGNMMPKVIRVDASLDKAIKMGGYEYEENNGVVVMEAERFARSVQKPGTQWTVIPDMG